MTRTESAVAAILGVGLLAAAPPPANLITDGGFETPAIAAGAYKLFTPGQSFDGWTVVGVPSGNVAVVSGEFHQNGIRFPAATGKQFLDLTGVSNKADGVSQTVSTTPGTAYRLSFSIGNVDDPSGVFGAASTVDVEVDGKYLMSAVNAEGKGTPVQVWKTFTTSITAASSTTTITFLNRDTPTDNDNGLDDVSLVPVAASASNAG